MSYISTLKVSDQVFVWERHGPKLEDRVMKTYEAPYYFYTPDPEGEHVSMYGDILRKYDQFDNGKHFHSVKSKLKGNGIKLFESDIPPELKVLSAEYYGQEAPKLNVSFLDIEVDYNREQGFSSIEDPYAEINAIAIYHQWSNKYVIFAIPPGDATCEVPACGPADQSFIDAMNDIAPMETDVDIDIRFFATEKQLIKAMLDEFENSDVLCGWNSDYFDIPYIVKRVEKVGGKRMARRMCFDETGKVPTWREAPNGFGQDVWVTELYGRCKVDYMQLFKKYEVAERPSYKLESIADEVLPEMPKLHYTGSLAELYRADFNYFIRYNIRDTEILKGFEDKLGYVALANEMIHLSTGEFKHVGGTLKLAELATINYCHNVIEPPVIVNDMEQHGSGQIQGALVLLPQKGLHKLVGSVDIGSLYPSGIRSINISPETIIGQFTLKPDPVTTVTDENTPHLALLSGATHHISNQTLHDLTLEYDDGRVETRTGAEWHEFLTGQKWSVSGYGTVFNQNVQGIIPKILEDWYAQRKVFQKQMREALSAGNKDEAAYYDRLQYVYKIKLNSFYGALTNQYFRFYDLRMGESTTGTGRAILLHQCAQSVKELDGVYQLPDISVIKTDKGIDKQHWGYSDKWSVVYGDTDSTYFETNSANIADAIERADEIGELVNATFPDFMEQSFLCGPVYKEHIKTGREIVSSSGIFVDKKRYILHIVDNEGQTVDKMKVMGLDTKKTTMPKEVANKLNGFVEDFLKGKDWNEIAEEIVAYKDALRDTDDVMTIGLPKGIKGVEAYTEDLKIYGDGTRLPGHVAAAILYNKCLEQFGDQDSQKIISGMKIKVFYLAKTVGRFKSIAIPVDAGVPPDWFLREFDIDYDAHILRLVDRPLDNIIKAIGKDTPTRQSMLIETLMEF